MKFITWIAAAFVLAGCRASPPPEAPISMPVKKEPPPVFQIVTGKFRIEFQDLRKNRFAESLEVGVVRVTIHKADPWAGDVTWSADQHEGERIGFRLDGTRWTAWHHVHSPNLGKTDLVKFDTGLVLKEITPYQVVGIGDRTYTADEVIVEKQDGSWDWLHYPVDPRDSWVLAPRVSRPPPGPRPPQGLLPATREVVWLLHQADDFWLSKNPRTRQNAQANYRRLLKDYKYVDVIINNRERIKSRAEAEIGE